VSVSIGSQSPDIAMGVDDAYEERAEHSSDPLDRQGAGDQGLMFGLRVRRHARAHAAADRTGAPPRDAPVQRAQGRDAALPAPDGKTQVTIEFDGHRPVRLDTVVVSTQHAGRHRPRRDARPRHRAARRPPVLESVDLDSTRHRTLVNPTGRFEIGGPMGDAGPHRPQDHRRHVRRDGTPRRRRVLRQGPVQGGPLGGLRHALGGQERRGAGLARRCEVQVAYAIGKAHPVGLFVETFGTETLPVDRIQDAVVEIFDLRPAAIIRDLDLLRPIYAQTAAYGHFGRDVPDFTWERTDRVDALRTATGL
jgi:S-adenosylmethionine synthetase